MRDHWEQVYRTKAADTVSWFQPRATQSLAWIEDIVMPRDARRREWAAVDDFQPASL